MRLSSYICVFSFSVFVLLVIACVTPTPERIYQDVVTTRVVTGEKPIIQEVVVEKPVNKKLLSDSVDLWKPVVEAYPTRMMWGIDLYYWWHYEPDVLHEIVEFGRDFITQLDPNVQERFAYRNALEMLNIKSE